MSLFFGYVITRTATQFRYSEVSETKAKIRSYPTMISSFAASAREESGRTKRCVLKLWEITGSSLALPVTPGNLWFLCYEIINLSGSLQIRFLDKRNRICTERAFSDYVFWSDETCASSSWILFWSVETLFSMSGNV